MSTARPAPQAQREDAPAGPATTPAGPAAATSIGSALPDRILALQRAAGNAAVARAVNAGALRPARAYIARLIKNPFDQATSWKSAADAATAIDTYAAQPEADRRAFVAASYTKDLVRVLAALSPEDQVHKYRAQIMEICRWVEEEETRASAKMTDDQIAETQKNWARKQAEDAAKAAAAAKAPKNAPVKAPTEGEIQAEREKQLESTSIKPAGPVGWDAKPAAEKKAWTDRGNKAVTAVVAHATAKHPELKVKASHFRLAFKDVEARGLNVLAFGESDGAGGTRAAVGYRFVEAVELDPAYVMDIVVHEIYGHPEYGTYGTEYHLKLYDAAMAKMPGYVKPAAGTPARRSEIDAYAYQETEMYSVFRSMPYHTTPKAADAGKVPQLDAQVIADWRVGLMKQQWAPTLIVPVLRGFRKRLVIDPRIRAAALTAFDKAVGKNFDAATEAAVKK